VRSWRTGLPDLQVHCEEQTQLLNLYKASASGLRIANAALRVDLLPSALSPFVRPIIERPEAKIIAAVKQVESGRKVEEIAREVGVSKHTIYAWKQKYGGLEVAEAQELKHLREENSKLKKLVAEYALDKEALKSVIAKNGYSS
jgi:putative transposase